MKILVADDDEVSALVLSDRLEALGYQVTVVTNGLDAWELLQRESFRLLIIDWMMPEMDGLELCRRVRARPNSSYVYVIFLTGRTDRKDRLMALDGGVDDFLPKPLDSGELLARLKAADRILRSEEALRLTNEELTHARRSELRTGGEIQRRLLQASPPKLVAGFELASLNIPSQEVDGDFVDFFPFGEGIVDVVAADVMGKGVPAALTGAGVKTTLMRCLISLLSPGTARLPDLRDLLGAVNQTVAPELIELQSFLTLCYARFDWRMGTLRYVNCGHPRLIHWSAAEDVVRLLPTTAMPLGFVEHAVFDEAEIPLGLGDLVLLYSDGITDLIVDGGGRLGMQGFAQWVSPRVSDPPSALIEGLRNLRESSPGPVARRDDFSCVAVRVTYGRAKGASFCQWATTDNLRLIRDHVRERVESSGLIFSRGETSELLLAIQEAASNAVRHARPGAGGIPLSVTVTRIEDRIRVEMMYPGVSFDPTVVPAPVLDGSKDGGFGVSIIFRSMDSVTYGTKAGQNLLVMEKAPGRSAQRREEQ